MKDINPDLLKKCISIVDYGVILSVEVKPGSKIQTIFGVNQFRESLTIMIKRVAEKGQANRELINYLSSILSVSASDLVIIKGATSRNKKIMIHGITQDEVIKKLTDFIYE